LKKLKKKKIIIIFILIVMLLVASAYGRYRIIRNEDFFGRTKEFYFNSDKLSESSPFYKIENWAGSDNYIININVNSRGNEILGADYAIDYALSVECSDNVLCQLSKSTGTIPGVTHSDTFSVTVVPNASFNLGDIVELTVTASTEIPYEKTISADFQFVIGQEKVTYEIIDNPNSPYLEVNIFNTFTNSSGIVTLQFDPQDVLIDMTNQNYIDATSTDNVQISAYSFINEITFEINALTSTSVRFYKTNITEDYTYPNPSGTSIITVIGAEGLPYEQQDIQITVKHKDDVGGTLQSDDTISAILNSSKLVNSATITNMCVSHVKYNGNVVVTVTSTPVTNYTIVKAKNGDIVEFIYAPDLNGDGLPDTAPQSVSITVKHKDDVGATLKSDDIVTGTLNVSKLVNATSITNMCVSQVKYNGAVVATTSVTPITDYTISSAKSGDIVEFIYVPDLNGDGIPDSLQNVTITVKHKDGVGGTLQSDDTVTGTLNLSKLVNSASIANMCVGEVKLNGSVVVTVTSTPVTSYTISSAKNGDIVEFIYAPDLNGDGLPDTAPTTATITVKHQNTGGTRVKTR